MNTFVMLSTGSLYRLGNLHMTVAKSSPDFCISRSICAPLIVAEIFARERMIRGSSRSFELSSSQTAQSLLGQTVGMPPKSLTLFQNNEPGESCLKALEHKHFPECSTVVLGNAPFLIVIVQ